MLLLLYEFGNGLMWEEGIAMHQTSSLFTIITKHSIHHRQTTKKKRRDRKGQELHGNIQKRIRIKPLPRKIKKDKKKTTDIHNNKKLRNLYTGINIHPTPIHMIAEPFDSSMRMK